MMLYVEFQDHVRKKVSLHQQWQRSVRAYVAHLVNPEDAYVFLC